MQEQINKQQKQINEMEKIIKELTEKLKSVTDTTYKTAKREIINHEVQFLQKVYDKNGNIVTEINP